MDKSGWLFFARILQRQTQLCSETQIAIKFSQVDVDDTAAEQPSKAQNS